MRKNLKHDLNIITTQGFTRRESDIDRERIDLCVEKIDRLLDSFDFVKCSFTDQYNNSGTIDVSDVIRTNKDSEGKYHGEAIALESFGSFSPMQSKLNLERIKRLEIINESFIL